MKSITEVITELRQKQNNFVGEWDEYDRIGETIDLLESASQWLFFLFAQNVKLLELQIFPKFVVIVSAS